MVNSKIYLNVPFSQKDAAKALGAKWDAGKKKWYAPNGLDIALFEKWNQSSGTSASKKTKIKSGNTTASGTITLAKDTDFIAYNGDQPPWNN